MCVLGWRATVAQTGRQSQRLRCTPHLRVSNLLYFSHGSRDFPFRPCVLAGLAHWQHVLYSLLSCQRALRGLHLPSILVLFSQLSHPYICLVNLRTLSMKCGSLRHPRPPKFSQTALPPIDRGPVRVYLFLSSDERGLVKTKFLASAFSLLFVVLSASLPF